MSFHYVSTTPNGFEGLYDHIKELMIDDALLVHSRRWQGAEIADNPNMATFELTHGHFDIDLEGYDQDLEAYARHIGPELPWADNHFEERVCGYPINPGTHWANWSHNSKAGAATFLDDRGKFNHNYMERYWPKFAGAVKSSTVDRDDFRERLRYISKEHGVPPIHHGIMYDYGDLDEVVDLLVGDPYTRQAYLPVWFPEDTGGGSKRAPCTIGYHFLMRNGRLDINYHIRSCDFYKHFRNDIYLTIRLLDWVLRRAAGKSDNWKEVTVGRFIMQIGSLHVFRVDWEKL